MYGTLQYREPAKLLANVIAQFAIRPLAEPLALLPFHWQIGQRSFP